MKKFIKLNLFGTLMISLLLFNVFSLVNAQNSDTSSSNLGRVEKIKKSISTTSTEWMKILWSFPLADAYDSTGDHYTADSVRQKALQEAQNILQTKPDSSEASGVRYVLCEIYYAREKQWAKIIDLYDPVLLQYDKYESKWGVDKKKSNTSDYIDIAISLGNAAQNLGKYDKAISYYRKATQGWDRENPNISIDSAYDLGIINRQIDEYSRKKRNGINVTKDEETQFMVNTTKYYLYEKREHFVGLWNELAKANAQYCIAKIYDENLNDVSNAIKEYKRLLDAYPDDIYIGEDNQLNILKLKNNAEERLKVLESK